MKNVVLGGLVGAALVFLALGWQGPIQPVFADGSQPGTYATDDLIAFPTTLPDGRQLVTVVNPRLQSMAVYAIGSTTEGVGHIELKSVRSMYYDLQMREYNVTGVRPIEIQGALQAIPQGP
jgi:hypothetical protein